MPIKTFNVEGLTCTDCAARIQAAVGQVQGVDDCQVDLASGTLTVSLARSDLPTEEIAEVVKAAGYTLSTNRRRSEKPLLGFIRFILSKRMTLLGLALDLLHKSF